jgi:hypothetical protein
MFSLMTDLNQEAISDEEVERHGQDPAEIIIISDDQRKQNSETICKHEAISVTRTPCLLKSEGLKPHTECIDAERVWKSEIHNRNRLWPILRPTRESTSEMRVDLQRLCFES